VAKNVFSTVYYCERKPESKKQSRPRNETSKISCLLLPSFLALPIVEEKIEGLELATQHYVVLIKMCFITPLEKVMNQ